jgi:tetratricopeptide (TPR) repeat protein
VAGSFLLPAQKRNKKAEKKSVEEYTNRQAEELFIDGNKEFHLGRYPKAADFFHRALKFQPKTAAIYYKLTECYGEMRMLDKAFEMCQKAVEYAPENTHYTFYLAQMLEGQKKYKEAIKIYEKLIKAHKGQENLLLLIANLQVLLNEDNEAIKTYNKIEEIFGLNEEVIKQRQLLHLKHNRMPEVINEWKKLLEANPDNEYMLLDFVEMLYGFNRKDEAKKILQEYVSKNPNNPYLSLAFFKLYQSEGKVNEADTELQKAFQSPNIEIDAKIHVLFTILRQPSIDSLTQKRLTILGDMLVKTHPNEAKAHSMNGDILLLQEFKKEALSCYIKTAQLDNSQLEVWNRIFEISSELNLNDTIIKYAENATEVFPTHPLFYFYAGMAYSSIKNHHKALEWYENGKKLVVNNNEYLVQFLIQIGDSYNNLKEYIKSDSSFEQALRIEPDNPHVLNNYSYYLSLRKERLEEAKKMCEKMLQKKPDEPAYLDTYGWVLYQIKDYASAKKYIEKALEKTDDVTIIEHYGDVLYQLGEKEKAISAWEKAKKGDGYSELLDKKIEGKRLYE